VTNPQPSPGSTVPFIFKVFSLHRYFAWYAEMREHYVQVGMQVAPTPRFFEN
jgi:hypothetical protein